MDLWAEAAPCLKAVLFLPSCTRGLEKQYLNPDITEPEQVKAMLKPYPPGKMEFWRAPDEVKNPRNDYPELLKPVEETGQQSFL
jgi:putative SOS response-associated peptidase YedK